MGKVRAPFEPTHHIAIDGSQRGSALAIAVPGGSISKADTYKVGGVENIGGFKPLLDLARGCSGVQVFGSSGEAHQEVRGPGECRPLVMIECPDWTGRGTREVVSSVTAWESHLMRTFPKRRVLRVAPSTWQTALFGKREKRIYPESTKLMSLWYCQHVLHRDLGDDHDQADALCILAYLRLQERLR